MIEKPDMFMLAASDIWWQLVEACHFQAGSAFCEAPVSATCSKTGARHLPESHQVARRAEVLELLVQPRARHVRHGLLDQLRCVVRGA